MNKFQKNRIKSSIAASDAFFPFADGIKLLIAAGVKIIVQPAMVTGTRTNIVGQLIKLKLRWFLLIFDISTIN